MIYRLLDILRCPNDGGFPLAINVGSETVIRQTHKQPQRCRLSCALEYDLPPFDACVDCHQREIVEGTLTCPICGQHFQIIDGIADLISPDFLDNEDSDEIMDQRAEMETRDLMATRYDSMPPMRWTARFEIPAAANILNRAPNGSVIELGCGTGRPTAVLARQSSFFLAVDFSMNSLRVCRQKLTQSPHVQFVRAEISRLPVRDGTFDTALSLEVFEHLPGALMRAMAVQEAARVLADNGHFIISVYRESWFSRILGKKESYHFGGIYYFRFTPADLQEMLAPYFKIDIHHQQLGGLVQMAGCQKELLGGSNKILEDSREPKA